MLLLCSMHSRAMEYGFMDSAAPKRIMCLVHSISVSSLSKSPASSELLLILCLCFGKSLLVVFQRCKHCLPCNKPA